MRARSNLQVTVGLSGGVDSAVAAMLLLEQGFEVHGLFMKNWEDDDTATRCTAEEDIAAAKRVAAELEIPLHFANFSHRYKDEVFAHFISEHRAGRTPNPDILCNIQIKFRAFPDHASRLGADLIATGHYARRISEDGNRMSLGRGADPDKDQSYFLHALTQDQLRRSLFPLGELGKSQVRRLAEEAGLPNFDRPDSTGICFIGERDFRDFLARYLPTQPGPINDEFGHTIGEHLGTAFYTLGQRHGLGIGGNAETSGEPWYVAEKRVDDNILIAVQGHEHPLLLKDTLGARELHWVSGHEPPGPIHLSAKIRYRQIDQPCLLIPGGDHCEVQFHRSQRAITPGQSVVFYRDDMCLGGGHHRARLEPSRTHCHPWLRIARTAIAPWRWRASFRQARWLLRPRARGAATPPR